MHVAIVAPKYLVDPARDTARFLSARLDGLFEPALRDLLDQLDTLDSLYPIRPTNPLKDKLASQ